MFTATLFFSTAAGASGQVPTSPSSPGSAQNPDSLANISIKYPADNGAVPGGTKVSVKWFSNNTTANSVKVEVAEDGTTWKTLASGKPSNGTADWDVPATNFPGAKVRVTGNTTGGPINATSNNVYIDSILPTSVVHDMGGFKNCIDAAPNGGKVDVPFSAWDNQSGIWYVELWWRIEHRGGSFAEALESRTNKSPFIYDMAKEGTYELYSIAIDRAGNREKTKYFNDTSVTLDRETPQVFATVPEPDTQIPFWPSFQILMSEKMNFIDTTEIKIEPPGPQPVRRNWDEYYSTLSFALDQPLIPGKHYNVTISGTKDKCSKPLLPMKIHYQVADPPRPSEGNISGQVVHAFTQDIVPDATVEAWYSGTVSMIKSDTSDAGGLYDLERMPPTSYNLVFRATGFQESNYTTTLDPDGRPFIKLELVPEGEQAGWVRGTVTGADKKPIEDATLGAGTGSKATTDKNGRYQLTLRPGKNTIKVAKAGVAELTIEVEVNAGQTITKNILLAPPGPGRSNLVAGIVIIAVSVLLGLLVLGAAAQRRSKARAMAGAPPAPPGTAVQPSAVGAAPPPESATPPPASEPPPPPP